MLGLLISIFSKKPNNQEPVFWGFSASHNRLENNRIFQYCWLVSCVFHNSKLAPDTDITSLPQVSLTFGNTDFKNSYTETAHKAQSQVSLLGSVTQNRAQGEEVTKGKPPEMRKNFADSGCLTLYLPMVHLIRSWIKTKKSLSERGTHILM